LHATYNQVSFSETAKFFGLCLLLQMAVLYGLGRSLRDVAAPMLTIFLSVLWTLGLTELLGYKLNLFIIMVPVLLCCAGIGDSMHIIELFRQNLARGMGRGAALRAAMGRAGWPCLITSVTTAAGFISFQSSDIPPFREMGVYAALGTMVAYALSFLVCLVIYGPRRAEPAQSPESRESQAAGPVLKKDAFARFLGAVADFDLAHPRAILIAAALLMALSVVGYLRIVTETDTIRMFSPQVPLRQAYDFVDRAMGGAMSVELLLDSGTAEGARDPEFLLKAEELQNFLDRRPEVTKTASLLNIIKKINQALHGGGPESYALPRGREAAAQCLWLYETSNGRDLDKLMSFDGRYARLTAKTASLDTQGVRALTEAAYAKAAEIFQDPGAVSATGSLEWTRSMNDLQVSGQRGTFLSAFVTISLVMCLALRSIRLGLLSMIPNVFPVMLTLGFVGAAGLYMDMPLMSFSPVIIGLVVDDTTHFLYGFRGSFLSLGTYREALRSTLMTVGRPMLFTTGTLVCGFLILPLSQITGVAKFGGLACLAFLLAILADLMLMPAVLLAFKPLGPERVQGALAGPAGEPGEGRRIG
jgi:predicted RND superfamily exporter protein